MHVVLGSLPARTIIYPGLDGEPMSANTKQFSWIVTLASNLDALFADRVDVFVSGNQFWYPVEGEMEIKAAPSVYAVFGRPKGDRVAYRQWEENNVPMTVVFEVLSPNNTYQEMADKFAFYEDYGVEEYYVYSPDKNTLHGYLRQEDVLVRVRKINGHVSPRLGVRFDLSGPEMVVRYPDGLPFLTFKELDALAEEARQEAEQAKQRAAQNVHPSTIS